MVLLAENKMQLHPGLNSWSSHSEPGISNFCFCFNLLSFWRFEIKNDSDQCGFSDNKECNPDWGSLSSDSDVGAICTHVNWEIISYVFLHEQSCSRSFWTNEICYVPDSQQQRPHNRKLRANKTRTFSLWLSCELTIPATVKLKTTTCFW